MSKKLWERYGPYPKKKEGKRGRFKERGILKQRSEWIGWKITNSGDSSFYHPCLTH
jgi:hypothetical protein